MNWNQVDNQLAKYQKEYKNNQLELKDNIQSIFDLGITSLSKIVTQTDLSRFKRYVAKNEELIKENDYVSYLAQKMAKRSKINYKELQDTMILIEYAKFEQKNYTAQFDTLSNIVTEQANNAEEMCKKLGFRKKGKMDPINSLILAYLVTPNNLGVTYKEQNDANTIYNASEIQKQANIYVDQAKTPSVNDPAFVDIFKKQEKREINKKTSKNKKYDDKYSGYIDNESSSLINQINLEIFKDYGVEKVIFRTVHDANRTLMCSTLSEQKFYINKMNTYSRYSKADDRNVIYHTLGLVLGQNLPPITNNFHFCRSWVEPIKDGNEN